MDTGGPVPMPLAAMETAVPLWASESLVPTVIPFVPDSNATVYPPNPALLGRDFSFTITYLMCAITAVVLFVKSLLSPMSHSKQHQTQRMFLALTFVQTIVRCVFFLVASLAELNTPLRVNSVALNVIASLPTVLYFTMFSILLYHWVTLYHFAYSSRRASIAVRTLIVLLNVLFYADAVAFYVITYASPVASDYSQIIYFSSLGTFSLVLALFFAFYGFRLYRAFRHVSIRAGPRKSIAVTRVGLVACVCVVCFVVRGVILIVDRAGIDQFTVFIVYFLCSEIVPTIVMLIVFNDVPKNLAVAADRRTDSLLSGPINESNESEALLARQQYIRRSRPPIEVTPIYYDKLIE